MKHKLEGPDLNNFIVGTGAGILIIVCFALSFATAAPLRIILFIPDQLGLIRRVTPENTLTFETSGRYRLPNFPTGPYLIYFDAGMPTATIELLSETTGVQVAVIAFPGNGLKVDQPYLEPNPIDLPSYRFQIDSKDTYLLHLDFWGVGGLKIIPDVSTHNDMVLIGALIIQLAVLGFSLWAVYRRWNRDRWAVEKTRKAAGREKYED